MKTFKNLFAIAFICITAFACSSDDDSGSDGDNQAKLIGTWKFTSSSTDGVVDTDYYICDYEDTLVINSSTVTASYYEDPSGNDGSNCQFVDSYMFNYNIDGNMITNTDDGYTSEIITLNSTTFIFEETETFEGTTYVYTETYTKQ